jgi:Transposase
MPRHPPRCGLILSGFRRAKSGATELGNRRVKNDERDARDLADWLRLGRLAESWIAPSAIRELRELVRYRAKGSAAGSVGVPARRCWRSAK